MFKRLLSLMTIIFLSSTTQMYILAQENTAIENDQQFINFLEDLLANGVVDSKTTNKFNHVSRSYWDKHKLEYNLHPEKYEKAISLFHQNQHKFKHDSSIEINRYENAIESFRRFDNRNSLAKNPILFVGSSSIGYWETAISFPELPIINRGFGGASLGEIIHYYDDVIKKHSPSILVVYCDIDIENGKSPSIAVDAFKALVNKVKADLPQTQILLLSMKPTLIDDFIGKDVRKNKVITNKKLMKYCIGEKNLHYIDISSPMLKPDGSLRSDIFLSDGMHLNQLGYTLWDPIISKKIASLIKPK